MKSGYAGYKLDTQDTWDIQDKDWIHGIQNGYTGYRIWIHGIQNGYTGYRLDTRDTDRIHRIKPGYMGYKLDTLDTQDTQDKDWIHGI